MPEPLPPDLSLLGDEIVAAAERVVRARRRRGVLLERGAVAAAAALILAAGVPGALAPAVRTGEPLSLASITSTGAEADHRPGCYRARAVPPSPGQRRALRRELAAGLGWRGRAQSWWALPPKLGRPRAE